MTRIDLDLLLSVFNIGLSLFILILLLLRSTSKKRNRSAAHSEHWLNSIFLLLMALLFLMMENLVLNPVSASTLPWHFRAMYHYTLFNLLPGAALASGLIYLLSVLMRKSASDREHKAGSGIDELLADPAMDDTYSPEGKIRNENTLLSVAVEQSPISVVITDTDGKIEYVNPQFSRITGYSPAEVIGENPRILRSQHHDAGFYKALWDTIKSGKIWTGEFKNIKKDGDIYWEESTIGPIFNDRGKISRFIALKMDITDNKELKERDKQLQNQLIQSNKMAGLGVLSAGLAHEINNPNNFIHYNSELVRTLVSEFLEKVPEDDRGKYGENIGIIDKLLTGITEGAQRINRIVESLKTFSRQSEKEDLILEKNHINDMLDDVVTMMNYHIRKSTENFRIEMADDIPWAYWDAPKIEQVLVNLIENAIHALNDRQSGILLRTAYNSTDETVSILIHDEGRGIDPAILEKIMEPFYTTKKNVGGTGLGLSISYAIIREHDGDIKISSEAGKGTDVLVLLPVNRSKAILQ